MEFVAWFSHKYIMHGVLWRWHKDHHVNDVKRPDDAIQHQNGFEKNDLFFLTFAIPAMLIMITGIVGAKSHLIYISVGITLYGITYFLFHDVLYHKRIGFKLLQKTNSRYLKAIIKAHRGHHKPKNKSDFESYGLLVFPLRYLKE